MTVTVLGPLPQPTLHTVVVVKNPDGHPSDLLGHVHALLGTTVGLDPAGAVRVTVKVVVNPTVV